MHTVRMSANNILPRANRHGSSNLYWNSLGERGTQMTLGYAGHARLEAEDDEIAICSYTGEDWNAHDESVRDALVSDSGQLTISKFCLIEPEIRSKVRKINGRKRLVEKTIVRDPDLADLIRNGDIVADKLCAVDSEASAYRPPIYARLLRLIFRSYQGNGRLPEKEGFIV